MEVKLVSAHINNFKNMSNSKINFSNITNIMGGNGTGKTTVYDAVTWTICGKDSKDRRDFEIKPLKRDGRAVHGVETMVSLELLVNEKPLFLKKVYREKWTKKRGEAKRQFTGHETIYYINEVSVTLKDYTEKINEIITEDVFKMLSSPYYFSALNWKEQMKILLEVAGNVGNEEVIKKNIRLLPLREPLETYVVEDYKKHLMGKARKIKKELEAIPHRIDECNGQIFVADFIALETQRDEAVDKIEKIKKVLKKHGEEASKTTLEDIKRREEYLKEQEELSKIKREVSEGFNRKIKNAEEKLNEVRRTKSRVLNIISIFNEERSQMLGRINVLKKTEDNLRKAFEIEDEKIFKNPFNEKVCPTCLRAFDEDFKAKRLEEAMTLFEKEKDKKIEEINRLGIEAVREKNRVLEEVKEKERLKFHHLTEARNLNEEEETLKEIIENLLEDEKESLNKYGNLVATFRAREIEEEATNKVELEALEEEEKALSFGLNGINKTLEKRESNNRLKERIGELTRRERELSDELASTERMEFLCEEFIKTKVSMLEDSINNKFEKVRFKLFNELINGGVTECCECTFDGVPYSNLNTGSQINTGLQIIKALSNHYRVFAPVFIDNRESVNEVYGGFTQMVNLIVSKDKALLVKEGGENPLMEPKKVEERAGATKEERVRKTKREADF